jgi:hypothetical protein
MAKIIRIIAMDQTKCGGSCGPQWAHGGGREREEKAEMLKC